MSNDDIVKQKIGALRRVALGNVLLIVSWAVAAAAGISFAHGWPEDMTFAGLVLLVLGVTCWPIGLWCISTPLRGVDRLLPLICRVASVVHAIWAGVGLVLLLCGHGMLVGWLIWSSRVVVIPVNLLTPFYASYAGDLGRRFKSPLAWMFWLWIPVSLLSTWLCAIPIDILPHWTVAVASATEGRAWLGDLAIAGFVLPVLIAHISLQWTLGKTILQTDLPGEEPRSEG